jgi:hypothetical protein
MWQLAIEFALDKVASTRSLADVVSDLRSEILPINVSHAEHAGGLPRRNE